MPSDYKHVQLLFYAYRFGINYDSGLTVATKPMDQYFCWCLGVHSRGSQVADDIDPQSVRRGAVIYVVVNEKL
jgi:hypothetical protein